MRMQNERNKGDREEDKDRQREKERDREKRKKKTKKDGRKGRFLQGLKLNDRLFLAKKSLRARIPMNIFQWFRV